ncbi:MAG: sulfotransferase [Thermomicrobiales bacterium]|nr:sulfotransferase [Thermomicrobiales bacterium]
MTATDAIRDARRPVAIVGMHRSGTSMVAKLLSQAGLNLGPDEALMSPAPENPEGFFEHLAFVALNDEVLNEAGAGWDCPPLAGTDWASADFDRHRERARELAAPLAERGPWGWKDPRTSLTIPFRESAFGRLRTVVVVRNPLEVVTSLHRRNGFSLALSLTLWQIYAERILAATSPECRLVTHFDAWFIDPVAETSRLASALNLPGLDASAVSPSANTGLRHHRKSLQDLREAGFPATTVETYRTLCEEAGWWEGVDVEPTHSVIQETDAAAVRGVGKVNLLRVENESLRRNIADFTTALAGRDARVSELEAALRMHEASRSELEAFLRERDGRLRERNAVLQLRDAALAERDQLAAARDAELSALRSDLSAARERVDELERAVVIGDLHERDMRRILDGLQQVQYQRDAEIMGTLGSVLSRHAPGAPASIYHRKLVSQIRDLVAAHVPEKSRVLVATYGDDALLQLGDRLTDVFPQPSSHISADYTDVSDESAIAQLGELREDGAAFLVVPSPALPWLAHHPALEHHLTEHHALVARERGVVSIYALRPGTAQIPA